MDILKNNIEKLYQLVKQNKLDDLNPVYWEIRNYVYENIAALNKNKQLKQEVADCLIFAAEKRLAQRPDRYYNYFVFAVAYSLNGDINEVCENLITYFNEAVNDESDDILPHQINSVLASDLLYLCNIFDDKVKKIFLDTMTELLEKKLPGRPLAYYVNSFKLLNVEYRGEKAEQALNYLTKAIELDKNFYFALWDIATIFYYDKNWKNAIIYFNKYIDIYTHHRLEGLNASIYHWLALCYAKIKDYEKEIESYKKCLEIDLEYKYTMNNLGYAYEKSKDYEQAFSWYKKSIKVGKDGNYPYRNFFRLLKKLKRYDEAIEFWEANKKRFSKSYQNEVDKMQEAKSKNIEPVLPDIIEDEEDDAVIQESPGREGKNKEILKSTSSSFSSESYLEAAIEDSINRGIPFAGLPLKMYEDNDGYGRQYVIPGIGRIDILAINTSSNDLYVIEFKKDIGDDEIVGQISRYMGWVKKNLASGSQNVYGIICVAQATEKLKYAAEANPNILISTHDVRVTLS